MKVWQKIYIFSLVIFVIMINSVGFFMVQNFHNGLMKKEVDNCLSEEKFLAFEFNLNSNPIGSLSTPISTYNDFNASINELMKNYSNSLKYEGSFQILDEQNNVIFTDFEFPAPPASPELDKLSTGTTYYLIRKLDKNYYIYVSSLINIYNTPLKIYYAKDISSLYREKTEHYIFFLKLSAFASCVLALCMFFISRFITKPIDTLVNSTKKIRTGDYSERVKLHSKDEFALLAEDFNLMAQTIEDHIAALKESNSEKEAFINSFTHELKTPLTSIIGYATFIRDTKYNEALCFEASDCIYKEAKYLERMAFKMMDLIYAKSQSLKLQPIDLLVLCQEVKETLRKKSEEKNITLIVDGNSSVLMLDETLIKILLLNIIENAIKASDTGSKIIITISLTPEHTMLSVKDFGIGISPEHIDKICNPFYIVDAARTHQNNGAGIGLAVCKKIVEVHHAQFNIESQLGEGTTITIIFDMEKTI